MAGEVGTAYVRLRPQTTGFQTEATSSLKRTLVGIGAAVGGFFAAQQALGFVKESVQTAASIQKSQEAIQATMGKSSRVVENFGRTAANNFAISAKDSDSFAARIGLLGQNIGLTNAQSANMTIQLEKLAGSFGMLKGEDPTPYLDALSSAVIGNTRGLKQMGIAINSTNELAAAERLGFIKTTVDATAVAAARAKVAEYTAKVSEEEKKYGKQSSQTLGATASLKSAQDGLNKTLAGSSSSTVSSLTAAQKAQVIMSVATSHLSALQKEASAHSGDLANQTIRLSAEWSNAKDEVGTALLPVVTELAKAFATDLPGAMHAFAQAFASAMGIATPLMAPVITGVRSLSTALYANRSVVVTVIGSMVAFKAATEAVSEVQQIGKDVIGAYNTVMESGRVLLDSTAASEQAATLATQEHAVAAGEAAAAASGEASAVGLADVAVAGSTDAALAAAVAGQEFALATTEAALAAQALATAEIPLGVALGILEGELAAATVAEEAYTASLIETEAVASGGALEGIGIFGAGLVALAGGPVTIAAAAVAGLGVGLAYFASTQSTAVELATNGLNRAFSQLDLVMGRLTSARKLLSSTLKSEPEDKLALAQAKLSVEQARANLSNKALNKTTLQHQQNLLELRSALLREKEAQKKVNEDDHAAWVAQIRITEGIKAHHRVLVALEKELHGIAKAEIERTIALQQSNPVIKARFDAAKGGLSVTERANQAVREAAAQEKDWAGRVQASADKQKNLTPLMRHNIDLLLEYGKKIGHIPSTKQTDIILAFKDKKALRTVMQDFQEAGVHANKFGHVVGEAFGKGAQAGMVFTEKTIQGESKTMVEKAFRAAQQAGKIGSPSVLFQDGVGRPIGDGIIKGINDRTQPIQQQIQQTLQSQIKPAKAEAKDIGTAVLQGILQPLDSLGRNLQSAIVDAANSAISGAKKALGIKSPSMLFSSQVGKPIADGILHGMGGLKAGLVNEIKTAAQSAMAASGGIAGGPSGTAATGANQAIGRQMMLAQGWGADQWGSLQALWNQESGWNQFARNPSSGAFGIPQELGHSVSSAYMAGDVRAQIAWGLDYIRGRYGSPAAAWAHEVRDNWYGDGGIVQGPYRGAPVVIGAHAGETILPTHKPSSNVASAAGVNIENLTVVSSSPHLWGQASDVMNAVSRKVRR